MVKVKFLDNVEQRSRSLGRKFWYGWKGITRKVHMKFLIQTGQKLWLRL